MGPVASLFTVLAGFTVLALMSWRWGADTRVGRDWEWGTQDSEPVGSDALVPGRPDGGRARRFSRRIRRFVADQAELHERLALLNRPWEETFLHWSGDADDLHLHGHVSPPRDGRRRSVTRGGWCPGLAREEHELRR
jgi:hypothetical protein